MIIQVNGDNHLGATEGLSAHIESVVEAVIGRFESRITRVEVHVGDEPSHKHGPHDSRCMMEARLAGHEPIAVTQHSPSVDEAVAGAADKLLAAIEHLIGKLERAEA